MSNSLRIALIAEGKTDYIIIEAALNAILPKPFILTMLPTENTRSELGEGWGKVLKWCQEFTHINPNVDTRSLATDPTLMDFDLIIIHIDADVAEKSYADYGTAVAQATATLPILPCSQPCPPPSNTVSQLQQLLLAWLGITQKDAKTVFCVPSKAGEAWLAAAILPEAHPLLTGIECNLNLETRLSVLPKALKVRKSVREYQSRASTITKNWTTVTALCSQAAIFHQDIEAKQL
ncbi:MAG: hypothetical protein H6996_03360 [Moraxellaceae bacterium]|nr:hypothetical protein [Pseudomonadales bacterium]MCB1673223.1 hypothetical protein [Pseudomonadales bacterium]MCP5174128.1 hypothetical protein [Moraxellaceae bacterium]MCP5176285.1 hypothetical protein [Moraxellaceae bacterium]HQV21742.1 hypothetical protein [Agitococcus sp.]